MGENNTYKIVSVIAIILGVVGVSLGYAAFSNTLTITSTAEVTPDSNNFNVDFSTSTSSVVAGSITPTLNPNNVTGFTADAATINNASDPTVTGIHATFTEPGQTATYSFYTYNAGQYIAYLKSIDFDGSQTCSAVDTGDAETTATDALVQAACAGISMTATVGNAGPTATDVTGITNHSLGLNGSEQVTIVITYAANSAIADGDFEVEFPDVVLTYKSVD